MTQPGQQTNTLIGFRFALEIQGIEKAQFSECTGLQAQTEVFEYKEGGMNDYSHKLPGRTTFSNITLKRGLTDTTELWDWYSNVRTKKDKASEVKSVSVVQYNEDGAEKLRWNLTGAFPVKWSGPGFNATNSSASIESFELAFAALALVKGR
jgi:phage tail-like protein